MFTLHRYLTFLILLTLVACNSSKGTIKKAPRKVVVNSSSSVQNLIKQAEKCRGIEYKYGGDSPKSGFDCSGFTQYLYKDINVSLPHSAQMQSKLGEKVRLSQCKEGDLVFFKNKSKVSHVALVVKVEGDDIFIAHSTSSKGVIFELLNDSAYWMERLSMIRRII